MQGWWINSSLCFPIWPGQKRHGSWRMTVNYQKFKQIVTPDAMSLLEEINTSAGTWYAAIDSENAFFLVSVYKDNQKPFAFSWQDQQYTFSFTSKIH